MTIVPPESDSTHKPIHQPSNLHAHDISRNEPILVVLLHGWQAGPESMNDLVRFIKNEAYNNCTVRCASLQFPANFFSNAKASDQTLLLERTIETLIESQKNSPQVILIGHSVGAVILRKAVLLGLGYTDQLGIKSQPKHWVSSVRRLLLLSSPNRGWTFKRWPKGIFKRVKWISFIILSVISPLIRDHILIFDLRWGSEFISQLRLQTIEAENQVETVQIRGLEDPVLRPEDVLDLASSGGINFRVIDLPKSHHYSVISLYPETDHSWQWLAWVRKLRRKMQSSWYRFINGEDNADAYQIRRDTIRQALGNYSVLNQIDNDKLSHCDNVQHVVLVINGIRSSSEPWKVAIKEELERTARARGLSIGIETSGYGYFPALFLLFETTRDMKVRWLRDTYTEARAKYPNAKKISCVGHSFGTHLICRAIETRGIRFNSIVLQNGIVASEYEWNAVSNSQAGAVRNDCGARDFIVSLFGGVFELIKHRHLGSAGVLGFEDAKGHENQFFFKALGHSGAHIAKNYASVAEFIFRDDTTSGARPYSHDHQLQQLQPMLMQQNKPSRFWGIITRAWLPLMVYVLWYGWLLGHISVGIHDPTALGTSILLCLILLWRI